MAASTGVVDSVTDVVDVSEVLAPARWKRLLKDARSASCVREDLNLFLIGWNLGPEERRRVSQVGTP